MILSENRYPPTDQARGHAFRDHASGDANRANLASQRPEPFELVLTQSAHLVAADEHLEHDAAVDIEECDERRRLAHEGPFDESDRGAALMPEMTVKTFWLHKVEIAAADFSGGDRPGDFEDGAVGRDDERPLA